jgi:ethanolamine utilization microcompartment shell protein EutL
VLAPVLFYLAVVALDYSSPGGPPRLAEPHLRAGAITAVALMPVTAWLTRLVATSESPPFAEVTLVALGGRRRQAARSTAVLAIAVVLTGVAMLWGGVADPAPYPAATVIALLGMHLAEACAGAGIGVLIAPPLRTRVGTAVAAVTGLTLVSLGVPWLPPLNPVLQAAFHHQTAGLPLLLLVTGQAAALGLACALVGTSVARARRPG